MHEVVILAIKGLAGGLLVVAFSLLSQGLSPKRFAGLFSAAPAVALAGLTVVLLDKGVHDARESAVSMTAGAAGMVAYALVVVSLLRHERAGIAASLALLAWVLVASAAALPIMVT